MASALLAFHVNNCLEGSIEGVESAHSTPEQKAQDQHESIGAAPSPSTEKFGELVQPLSEDAEPQAATYARAAYKQAAGAAVQQADLGASQITGSAGQSFSYE